MWWWVHLKIAETSINYCSCTIWSFVMLGMGLLCVALCVLWSRELRTNFDSFSELCIVNNAFLMESLQCRRCNAKCNRWIVNNELEMWTTSCVPWAMTKQLPSLHYGLRIVICWDIQGAVWCVNGKLPAASCEFWIEIEHERLEGSVDLIFDVVERLLSV